MICLKQSTLEAYIRDPVLAAWAIFGVELDVFQSFRLKMMWWVPEVIDDSGVSTGKSEILWIWAQLRAILLPQPGRFPHRIIGIYYPNLELAQTVFMPKFEKYAQLSKVFRAELKPTHGGKLGYQALKGCIQWVYRNNSVVQCPAMNLLQNSENQASKRFHDLGLDEAKVMDGASSSLDNQILSRGTAPGWNNNHPVHGNHLVLMGHAEDPDTHPFYRRVKAFRSLIRDGSQNHAIITSSYRDWSPEFQKNYRPDRQIRRDRLTMSRAKFRQQWEGVWEHGTEDWYDSKDVTAACTKKVQILTRRRSPQAIHAFGWDTAPGATRKADLNAGIVMTATPLPAGSRELRGVVRFENSVYRLHPSWGVEVLGRSAPELSGIIHRAHQRFGFRRIVFDPGGGGAWVQKELWQETQFFDGASRHVTGLCTPETAHLYPQAQPILCPFARGSMDLSHVWGEERFRSSDEGIIESIHRTAQGLFASGSILWTAAHDDLTPAERAELDAEETAALRVLTTAISQLLSIKVVVGSDLAPRMTKRGFLMFRAEGKRKKDIAYAWLYSLTALLSLLMDPEFHEDEGADDRCMVVG